MEFTGQDPKAPSLRKTNLCPNEKPNENRKPSFTVKASSTTKEPVAEEMHNQLIATANSSSILSNLKIVP
jgi:hypothetical protein